MGIENRNTSGVMIISDEVEKYQLGTWVIGISDTTVELPSEIVKQEREIIYRWSKAEEYEPTWVQDAYGMPSLIVRIDGTINEDKRVVYEVEQRPGWIGLANVHNKAFSTALAEVCETWPDLTVVMGDESKTLDDHLWVPNQRVAAVGTDAEHVLVRLEPGTEGLDALVDRAVAPVQTKGSKKYGVRMGLWVPVRDTEHLEEIMATKHTVFKPDGGSKLDGVRAVIKSGQPIELAEGRVITNRTRGAATRGNMLKTYAGESRQYYAQEFHPPIPGKRGEQDLFVAHRTYWGLNTETGEYNPLGGLWMGRPNVLLHGAADTVVGPIHVT